MKKFSIAALLLYASFPMISEAALVTCGTRASGKDCTLVDLFLMIKHIIDWVAVYLIIPLAVISIAVAGFMLMLSGAIPKHRTTAKDILTNVLIGLVLFFAAWLIVSTIVNAVIDPAVIKVPLQN